MKNEQCPGCFSQSEPGLIHCPVCGNGAIGAIQANHQPDRTLNEPKDMQQLGTTLYEMVQDAKSAVVENLYKVIGLYRQWNPAIRRRVEEAQKLSMLMGVPCKQR